MAKGIALLFLLVGGFFSGAAQAESREWFLKVSKFCDDGRYEWIVVSSWEDAMQTTDCDLSFEIVGEINADLAAAFIRVTEAFKGKNDLSAMTSTVILDSDGGSVRAAMEIGRRARELEMRVVVDIDRRCLSACVLMLAGGVQREINGPTGIHRAYFPPEDFAGLEFANAAEAYDTMAEEVRAYLKEMRVSERLFAAMEAVDVDDIELIGRLRSREFRLHGRDPVYSDLIRARILADLDQQTFAGIDAAARRMDEIADNCDWDEACMKRLNYSEALSRYVELEMPHESKLTNFYWENGVPMGTCRPCGETYNRDMQQGIVN